jgi:hypothetical protein
VTDVDRENALAVNFLRSRGLVLPLGDIRWAYLDAARELEQGRHRGEVAGSARTSADEVAARLLGRETIERAR